MSYPAICWSAPLWERGDAQNVKLRCDYKRLGLLVLSMVVYILIFKPVGYLISTAALLYAAMKIGRVKGWKIPAAVSVLASVFFFLVLRYFWQCRFRRACCFKGVATC